MNYYPSCNIVPHTHPEFCNIIGTHREDFPERSQRSPVQQDPDCQNIDLSHRIVSLLFDLFFNHDRRSVGKLAILLAVKDDDIRFALEFDRTIHTLLVDASRLETIAERFDPVPRVDEDPNLQTPPASTSPTEPPAFPADSREPLDWQGLVAHIHSRLREIEQLNATQAAELERLLQRTDLLSAARFGRTEPKPAAAHVAASDAQAPVAPVPGSSPTAQEGSL
jgi:hypothetical protein